MIYSELTVEEIKNLDKGHVVALFPLGAIEQHGFHLPVGTDAFIAENIAKRVEGKAKAKLLIPKLGQRLVVLLGSLSV